LLEGVQKFIAYKQDILKPERLAEIERLRDGFAVLVKNKASAEAIEAAAKPLTEACESATPPPEDPATRDWVESLVTCLVIVFAIRAYFLQPFKIPTGSMQPTLNGIIATPSKEGKPNIATAAWDYVSRGRNHVHVVSPCDGKIVGVTQTSYFLFSYSTIFFDNGQSVRCYAPARQLCAMAEYGDAGLWQLPIPMMPEKQGGSQASAYEKFVSAKAGGVPVKAGQLIAGGMVDAGDMVLVDKISYHFRQPHRGEVFVFNTRNIPKIQMDIREGSQHYIKRLAGTPGDSLEIKGYDLYVNGQRAEEPGFQRVMSRENGYQGYQQYYRMAPNAFLPLDPTKGPAHPYMPYQCKNCAEREYFAMGDNSYNSSDSRDWGRVPEANLVGPGLFTLWPFTQGHWGLIR
jgi:signal peptidase I